MVRSRRLVIAAIVIGFLFLSSTGAFAMESITLGLKYWYPEWELDGYNNFNTINWTTDYGMIGPTASFLFSERWAMSLSFLTGSFEKNFPMGSVTYYNYPSKADWSSQRNDLDLILAFIVNPYFNIFGGLKYLTYDQTIDGQWATGDRWQLSYDLEAAGLGFGVGLNVPIGSSFGLYSTLSLSGLGGTFDLSGQYTTSQEGDVIYPIVSLEAGARYNMQSIPLIFMGSLRYQQSTIEIDWADESSAPAFDSLDETFYGIVFFAGYRFSF